MYYSGVKAESRAIEGVGIIMTNDIHKQVLKHRAVNSRIMMITMKLGQVINIIQIYGPVEGTPEDEVVEFYRTLQEVLDEAREESETSIIMGDWNARVGKDQNRGMGCMGNQGEQVLNRNGTKMIEFCQNNDLIIGNTMWRQEEEDKYTFVAEERNAKSVIDYIVHTRSLNEVIQNIETRKEAEIGSNHRLVVAQLRARINKTEEISYSRIATYKLKIPENQLKYQERTNTLFISKKK